MYVNAEVQSSYKVVLHSSSMTEQVCSLPGMVAVG